jgi:ATP-dependent RNA helicase RhlE
VLVATDIAARGLDIDQLPHVVNYELPNVPEDYVHRIGRTGRAGNEGTAISLVSPDEQKLLRDIERLLKREVPKQVLEGYETTTQGRPEPVRTNGNNGRNGNRRSRKASNGSGRPNKTSNGGGRPNKAGNAKPAHARRRGRAAAKKVSARPGYSSLANRVFSD